MPRQTKNGRLVKDETKSKPDTLLEADYEGLYFPDEKYGDITIYDEDGNEIRCDETDFESDWRDSGCNIIIEDEHGINTTKRYVTEDDIEDIEVYKADNYTPQDYPNQEYEDYYKIVYKESGKVRYLRRTSPFFSDEFPDVWEEITEEEFNQYEN